MRTQQVITVCYGQAMAVTRVNSAAVLMQILIVDVGVQKLSLSISVSLYAIRWPKRSAHPRLSHTPRIINDEMRFVQPVDFILGQLLMRICVAISACPYHLILSLVHYIFLVLFGSIKNLMASSSSIELELFHAKNTCT